MTPTREQMLAEVREACILAKPEIVEGLHNINNVRAEFFPSKGLKKTPRPIHLADVLYAQNAVLPFKRGYMGKMTDTVLRWNLLRDSLDEQDDPTVAFIYQLFCAKP